MFTNRIILIALPFFFWSFVYNNDKSELADTKKNLKIEYTDKLTGDFSFAKKKHSIYCEAWCYEYDETTQIVAQKLGRDTIECYTMCNTSTHSSLHFFIANDSIINPHIELNSITSPKPFFYMCNEGLFKVDKTLFKKGILKAEFDMKFDHPEDPKKMMYWKGKIYAKIKSKK